MHCVPGLLDFCYTFYMKRLWLLCITLLGLSACNHYQTILVTLPDGFVVKALVADTPAKQERGLMFVTELPENRGMIFIFDREQDQLFWMKNTLIDLDMVFIRADKTVERVAAEVPHSYTYTPDEDVAKEWGFGKYVLELASKTAQKHGVIPQSQLQFTYEK